MSTNTRPREANFDRAVDNALREAYEHQETLRRQIEETKRCVAPNPRDVSPADRDDDTRP